MSAIRTQRATQLGRRNPNGNNSVSSLRKALAECRRAAGTLCSICGSRSVLSLDRTDDHDFNRSRACRDERLSTGGVPKATGASERPRRMEPEMRISSITPFQCLSEGNRRLCRATAPPQSAHRHKRSSPRNSALPDAAPSRTDRRPPTRGSEPRRARGISVRTRKSSTAEAAFRTSIPRTRATAITVSHTARGDVNRTGWFWARARSCRASVSSVSIAVRAEASTNIRTCRKGCR